MTSMHYELVLPEGITAGEATPTANWTSMFSSSEGRVSGISTTPNAFNGEGDILTMPLTISATQPLGDYEISFTEVRVNGNSMTTDATITVHVVDVHHMYLNENSTVMPAASNGAVNVNVKRTIPASMWSTICLPFNMTAEQTKADFGDDVEIADFKGYDSITDDEGHVIGINVNFETTTTITANRPCIIRVSEAVSEFWCDGVVVNPVEEPCVEYDNGKTGRQRIVLSTFMGTYRAGYSLASLCDEGYFPLFLSENKFWYATEKTQPMKAYRAYFDFYDVLSSIETAGARIKIGFGDDAVSGISRATNGRTTDTIFDLQGRQVNIRWRGLYIRNGKKLITGTPGSRRQRDVWDDTQEEDNDRF